VKISIIVSKKIDSRKKKGADKSGIDIGIIGIVRSMFIARSIILSCQLFKIALSVMVIVDMIGQIRGTKTMIDVSMDRSGEDNKLMIGWGEG
jgi:hypothetical protein